jgi:outer membrane protein TolC
LSQSLPKGIAALVVSLAMPVLAAAAEPVVLTVATAVQLAMERNESLGMARSDAVAASAHVREARADGVVDISARVDYTRNWLLPSIRFNDADVQIGSDNEIAGLLRLNQPLYTGGLVRGALQSARSQVTATEEAERQLRQAIIAQVETALYDYLLAAEIVRVRTLALQRARSNERQVDALRQAGRVTRFEWTRATVQIAVAESDSIESTHDLTLASLDLKDVVGMELSQEVTVEGSFRDTSNLASSRSVQDAIEEALQRRPEPRQLRAIAESYVGEERVAQSGTRPRLDLVAVGQMQFQDDALDGVGSAEDWRRSWSTGLMLEVPLFDGMRTRARVAQAREARRRVQLEAEQLDRAIEREVYRAWLEVSEARQRLRARQGSVGQARLGLEDADARYQKGAGTQLEVLDAHLTLVQAESEYARVRRDQSVALVALERAIGVLGEDVRN